VTIRVVDDEDLIQRLAARVGATLQVDGPDD
jgi:hypothetical protein